MKRCAPLLIALLVVVWITPASADNRFIVRTSGGLQTMQGICALLGCKVAGGLDGSLNQLFLVTTPDFVDPATFLKLLKSQLGVSNAELDGLLSVLQASASGVPSGLWDSAPVSYFGTTVWHGYVDQPAAEIIRLVDARRTYRVSGAGMVAVIDTGVDPGHPALQLVLVSGYDFTRNTEGAGSETADVSQPAGTSSDQRQPGKVNQSTMAVLDQSTMAVLDNPRYAAFGHGTMVAGIIHLVAPKTKIMPLKAFGPDGTGYTSDVLRAIYYAVQKKVKVINMSFSFVVYSQELMRAVNFANRQGVICVASAGNDGKDELLYPAAFQNYVMGIAATTDDDTRASFSNYGEDLVWMAAPGEGIITTYPFGTYAAGWGTSFSAPFVSGAVALLLDMEEDCNQYKAARALAHAKWISSELNHGRLDLYRAVEAWRDGN